MANHYLVKLTHDTGEIRYVRGLGVSGQQLYTLSEPIAHRFPSKADAKEQAQHYKGSGWTAEVVTVRG